MAAVVFFIASCSGGLVHSSEWVGPAHQLGEGKWRATVVHSEGQDQDVNLRVSQTDAISVNGVSYFSGVSNDFEAQGNGNATVLRVDFQPWENLEYFVKAGQGNYDLEVPSVTVRNRSTGRDQGLIYGAGVRALVAPDTIMTPAVAVEASMTHRHQKFDRLNGSEAIDHRLDLTEYQLAFTASKRWERLEPYGGVKIIRRVAVLKDKGSGDRVSGRTDEVSPFLGLSAQVFEHEFLVLEGSFLGDPQLSAGLSVRF